LYRVEFIGVPGSGKTTIRKKLIERLKQVEEERFLSVEEAVLEISREEIDKVYRIILNILPQSLALKFCNILLNRNLLQYHAQSRFLAEWGKSFESYLKSSAFDNMAINDRMIVISGLMEIGSLYECIKNGCLPGETVVFFEEGLIQKSFMFISPLTNEEAEKTSLYSYLNNIPLPDLIIYVKADLESCHERMIHRPDGLPKRLKGIDKATIFDFLTISDTHLQNVVYWLRVNKNIGLLEINNNQKLDKVMYDLERRIEAVFEQQWANLS